MYSSSPNTTKNDKITFQVFFFPSVRNFLATKTYMRAVSLLRSLAEVLLSLQFCNSGYIFHSYDRWLHIGRCAGDFEVVFQPVSWYSCPTDGLPGLLCYSGSCPIGYSSPPPIFWFSGISLLLWIRVENMFHYYFIKPVQMLQCALKYAPLLIKSPTTPA